MDPKFWRSKMDVSVVCLRNVFEFSSIKCRKIPFLFRKILQFLKKRGILVGFFNHLVGIGYVLRI